MPSSRQFYFHSPDHPRATEEHKLERFAVYVRCNRTGGMESAQSLHDKLPNSALKSRIAETTKRTRIGISSYRRGRPLHQCSKNLLLRALLVLALIFLFDDCRSVVLRHYLENYDPARTTTTITMVLSFSRASIMRKHRILAPNLSIVSIQTHKPASDLTMPCRTNIPGRNSRLYSSDVDTFFEDDVNRMLEEISNDQKNDNRSQTGVHGFQNDTISKSYWRNTLELSVEEDRDNDNLVHQISTPSPIEIRTIRGRTIHVKHDDQLRLSGSGISGNKARKMWTLNEIPAHEFPANIVSYGGPQSNSMVALAAIVNYKNRELLETSRTELLPRGEKEGTISTSANVEERLPFRFVYYAKKLPRFLRKQPNGNLFRAMSLGVDLIELKNEEYKDLFEHRSDMFEGPPSDLRPPGPDCLWVPQGGAFAPSQVGAQRLAQEIYNYWSESGNKDRPLTVCVPGGTCTTALLLHHSLKRLSGLQEENPKAEESDNLDYDDNLEFSTTDMDIEVVVVPCVGDASYARRQMRSLSVQIGGSPDDIPTILSPCPESGMVVDKSKRKTYFTFGKPNKQILETFQELQNDYNLSVDLIYGAPSFAIMFRHWDGEESRLSPDLTFDPNHPLEGREIMYVHSGGLEGINSQLLRYKYEGLVKIKDVQLPGRENRSKHRKNQ